MDLYEMITKEREIMDWLYENPEANEEGEDKLGQLVNTQEMIADKIDAYIFVLKERLPNEMALLEKKKAEIDDAIDRINGNLEKLKSRLAMLSQENPLLGSTKQIVFSPSKTSRINREKVEPEHLKIKTVINKTVFESLSEQIQQFFKHTESDVIYPGVKSLPEGHPAIEIVEKPGIKIINKK
jgi:hypothetical protein